MVSGELEALLAAGETALQAGDWPAARDAFEAALAVEEVPEALFGLGDALWWLGRLDACIEHRERAYATFRRRPDPAQAALSALLLSFDYRKQVGNHPAAAGWLNRATRLVDEHRIEELRGWVSFARAFHHEDPTAAEGWAREACATARGSDDRDLELCALSELGAALVRQGRVAEGVACLDEAMAASLGGEGTPETAVVTSCNMMLSCTECAEFERAVQWVRASDRFTRRYGCPFLYAECRVVLGAVLVATGEWARAEEELRAALDATAGSIPALHRQAVTALAELRLAQGRLEEAERLVAGTDDDTVTAGVRAALLLARGHPAVAAATVERRLQELGPDQLEGAALTELAGEAEIAQGHHEAAAARGRHLAELGQARACAVVAGRGERLWGRALAAGGDAGAARPHLEAARSTFTRLEMPLEAARVRLLLGETCGDTEPDVAATELAAALATFDHLGARRDADHAAALLRGFGVRTTPRRGPRDAAALTRREQEVLALLGEGLSNPEIAARLHLSRKTVEHHVARVLSKLGVRSRAEAAAEAVRQGAPSAPE